MAGLLALWAKEPARLVGFVMALLLALAAFGLNISPDQQTKIIEAVGAFIFMMGGAEVVRSQVSSPATTAKLVDKISKLQATVPTPKA